MSGAFYPRLLLRQVRLELFAALHKGKAVFTVCARQIITMSSAGSDIRIPMDLFGGVGGRAQHTTIVLQSCPRTPAIEELGAPGLQQDVKLFCLLCVRHSTRTAYLTSMQHQYTSFFGFHKPLMESLV